jgi:hypothetical protein
MNPSKKENISQGSKDIHFSRATTGFAEEARTSEDRQTE